MGQHAAQIKIEFERAQEHMKVQEQEEKRDRISGGWLGLLKDSPYRLRLLAKKRNEKLVECGVCCILVIAAST